MASSPQHTRFEDGVQKYYDTSGMLHREDGPAIVNSKTGASAHFLHGVLMTPVQHRWLRRRGALLRDAPADIVAFM